MTNAPPCPNCGFPAPGVYCPNCGQRQVDRRTTVRHLVKEFLDEQFGINNRTGRTLKKLLQPGRLTAEYFDGRIQQYIAPLRLYLISSLLFFAVVTLAPDFQLVEFHVTETGTGDRMAASQPMPADPPLVWYPANTDNWLRDVRINSAIPWLSRAVERNLHEFSLFGVAEGTDRLIQTIEAQIPTVFFVLLPFYALLLFIFFKKQRRYYVEHLVFALHLHSFAFLLFIPAVLIPTPSVGIATFGIAFIYILFALKHVYRQGWLLTSAKYLVLWALYLVYFTGGMAIAALVALTT